MHDFMIPVRTRGVSLSAVLFFIVFVLLLTLLIWCFILSSVLSDAQSKLSHLVEVQ
jgi:CHASE1-domain containing sensor protein